MREYSIDLRRYQKLIVGEGESDRNFFAEFCTVNGMESFEFGFAGVLNENQRPSGFDVFDQFLHSVTFLPGFRDVKDLILVCDCKENANTTLRDLRKKIKKANAALGRKLYTETPDANVLAMEGTPRLHVLMLPMGGIGGLESVCLTVATATHDKGDEIARWVDNFAEAACVKWPTERRDKLRLQAFLSASWPKKPSLHFSQLFDITRHHPIVPLDSPAFDDIRDYLKSVAAL